MNLRPSAPKADALPGCAMLRHAARAWRLYVLSPRRARPARWKTERKGAGRDMMEHNVPTNSRPKFAIHSSKTAAAVARLPRFPRDGMPRGEGSHLEQAGQQPTAQVSAAVRTFSIRSSPGRLTFRQQRRRHRESSGVSSPASLTLLVVAVVALFMVGGLCLALANGTGQGSLKRQRRQARRANELPGRRKYQERLYDGGDGA